MPWKRDDNNQLVMDDNGNPIRVDKDGNESGVNDEGIDSLNSAVSESIERKKKIQDLEKKLKTFEDVEDLQEYRKKADEAIEKVNNLNNQQLIDAGEAERVKKEIETAYESKLQEKDQALKDMDNKFREKVISEAVAGSEFVNTKSSFPTWDAALSYFRNNLDVDEQGRAIVYDHDGEMIRDKENPTKPADVDSGIQRLVDQHPQRDNFLKGNAGGSGSPPGGGGPGSGGEAMSRTDFIKEQLNG